MAKKKVFISPANHHKTCIVKGCSEAIHCNLIADELEPYLIASGLDVRRNIIGNDDSMDIVRQSNEYKPDLHFTFHTNAGGGKRCTFYNSGSAESVKATEIFAKNFATVYPNLIKPSKSYPASTLKENWNELKLTKAVSVYAEQWFHDNKEDSAWGHANIKATARAHAMSICEYLGVKFVDAGGSGTTPTKPPQEDNKLDYRKVKTEDGLLAIRKTPENKGTKVGDYKNGDVVQVLETNASGWCRTDKGWCYGGNGYLTKTNAPTVTPPATVTTISISLKKDVATALMEALRKAGV